MQPTAYTQATLASISAMLYQILCLCRSWFSKDRDTRKWLWKLTVSVAIDVTGIIFVVLYTKSGKPRWLAVWESMAALSTTYTDVRLHLFRGYFMLTTNRISSLCTLSSSASRNLHHWLPILDLGRAWSSRAWSRAWVSLTRIKPVVTNGYG